jgi:ATP-dependent Clp protease ATP-binding subunit ClpC
MAREAAAGVSGERAAIGAEDIARVVADSTGIPVTRLLKSETKKLAKLEEILHKHIIGQDEAVKTVSRYVRRSRAGIANPDRPLGSFIFLGPTGVGKTETAKVLAREVFENEEALVKVDMSEFMEGHSVSRLIGAPAGYVGYEEGGKLTEMVRRQPYSIVLFDEIEKAHREVMNILLQILDEGQLTDSHGRSVSFRNTIVIMTSNIGSQQLAQQARMGFDLPEEGAARQAASQRYEEMKSTVLKELHNHMAPELIGRIDQVVVYSPLDKNALLKVVDLHIKELEKRLVPKQITLDVSRGVREEIAEKALAEGKGARPIRHIVQEILEDPIASSVISEEVSEGQAILARKTGGRVTVTTK